MASNINATDIDITYPIAGQDNDTQGFRNNFTSIQDNFTVAATEITALQSNVGTLQSRVTQLNTYYINGITTLANLTQTQVVAISSPTPGMMVYNYTFGNAQIYTTHLGRWANVTLS